MKIVIDTNIFVSAALKDRSLPALAVHLALTQGVLLKSTETEAPLFNVLGRPYLSKLISSATHNWYKRLMAEAVLVTIKERVVACRDPTDDKFLELALSGAADLIVTGDADLLVLNPFRNIPIVSPATFVQGARI